MLAGALQLQATSFKKTIAFNLESMTSTLYQVVSLYFVPLCSVHSRVQVLSTLLDAERRCLSARRSVLWAKAVTAGPLPRNLHHHGSIARPLAGQTRRFDEQDTSATPMRCPTPLGLASDRGEQGMGSEGSGAGWRPARDEGLAFLELHHAQLRAGPDAPRGDEGPRHELDDSAPRADPQPRGILGADPLPPPSTRLQRPIHLGRHMAPKAFGPPIRAFELADRYQRTP